MSTAPQSDDLKHIVAHLWKRRIALLLAPPVFVLIAYGVIYFGVSESYVSRAQLMIRTPPSELRDGPRIAGSEAPVYEDILKNDELIHAVIKRMRENPNKVIADKFKMRNGGGYIEWLKSAFYVDTITTRDTSMVINYSPVIMLSVSAGSREAAKILADTWLDEILKRYGRVRQNEAAEIRKAAEADYKPAEGRMIELEKVMRSAELELNVLTRELDDINTTLLGPLTAPATRVEVGTASPEGPTGGSERDTLGLTQEEIRIEIDIAELQGGVGVDAARLERLKARLQAIQKIRTDLLNRRGEIDARRLELDLQLSQFKRDVNIVTQVMEEARRIIDAVQADATLVTDPLNADNAGTFIVLAKPQVPEFRKEPKRLLYSFICGLGLWVLLLMTFVLEAFMKRTLQERH